MERSNGSIRRPTRHVVLGGLAVLGFSAAHAPNKGHRHARSVHALELADHV